MNETYERVVFFNNCNNGDIHYSRQFVKYFAGKLGLPCSVSHFRCPSLLKDVLPYVRESTESLVDLPLVIHNNTLYVNTWIGNNKHKWFIFGEGCSLKGNYKMYEEYGNSLGISLPQEYEFIPDIDYSVFKIHGFVPQTDKNILICNGNAISGQAKNFNMTEMIISLSRKCPSCTFFVTERFENDSPNIIDANSLFDTAGNSNLNEISYLSTFCKIIVGRASGPFCFAHTKQNLFDSSKTFIVCSNSEREGNWATVSDYDIPHRAKQIWKECNVKNPNDCSISVIETIEDEINEKFGSR
jgi:hypothetical protein